MIPIACAEPWSKDVLSTGSKEVSLRLSKPTPNSICGVEQLPKSASPVLAEASVDAEEDAVAVAEAVTPPQSLAASVTEAASVAEADEASDETDAAVEPLPLETTLPWLSTTSWLAKSVVIPKTALNASACAPVFASAVLDAAMADWQVAFAVSSAPQVLVNVSHMN